MNVDEELLQKLVGHFGVQRLVAALPQKEVRKVLDLVSLQEMTAMLGTNYSTLHWYMDEGRIPYPQVRLVRRPYYTRNEAEAIVRAWPKI